MRPLLNQLSSRHASRLRNAARRSEGVRWVHYLLRNDEWFAGRASRRNTEAAEGEGLG